ncbi:MAG: sensor histidine kinase [Acidimicrobiales bacterium]
MASLTELIRENTSLGTTQTVHLQRLVASWGLLADLSFADLLLFVPLDTNEVENKFLVIAQIRPTTNQTVYRHDFVGQVVDEIERPFVARAERTGQMVEGEINFNFIPGVEVERARVMCIPVRCDGDIVAICSRESRPALGRQTGELERFYNNASARFANMMATGTFPFPVDDAESEEAPRVGDGVVILDGAGRVEYASPNAVSALHRVGVHANAEGLRLGELGLEEAVILTSLSTASPKTEEIERGQDVTILLRCLPLLEAGKATGALVLLRDISELRSRDRMLVSMDATIREIHHRVKNNLQTISSLLALQGRRLTSPEAKVAIEESVRRIRSIALVHEILSRATGDEVPFNEIVRPLVRMVEESVSSPERPVRFVVEGDSGTLADRVATPLAVVLTELLQNSVDHAFPELAEDSEEVMAEGHVLVSLSNDGDELVVQVIDDGVGLPSTFVLEESNGLGLSIVRSLVVSQLGGEIVMRGRAESHGTVAEVRVPLDAPQHLER